jgi:uncharacterized protein (TIGR02594 family)
VNLTALSVARTFLDLEETPGPKSNPLILGILQDVLPWVTDDSVPWCSAFAYHIAKMLGLQRPERRVAARARSWLRVGTPIELFEARPENDVVILKRGAGPGPEVLDAPGHVGFFAGRLPGQVALVGGNQGDMVSEARFHQADILGVRRLA